MNDVVTPINELSPVSGYLTHQRHLLVIAGGLPPVYVRCSFTATGQNSGCACECPQVGRRTPAYALEEPTAQGPQHT
jgi:hypothetical protein